MNKTHPFSLKLASGTVLYFKTAEQLAACWEKVAGQRGMDAWHEKHAQSATA